MFKDIYLQSKKLIEALLNLNLAHNVPYLQYTQR